MSEKLCESCKLFVQHYIKNYATLSISKLNCGHCPHKRGFITYEDMPTTCKYYIQNSINELIQTSKQKITHYVQDININLAKITRFLESF